MQEHLLFLFQNINTLTLVCESGSLSVTPRQKGQGFIRNPFLILNLFHFSKFFGGNIISDFYNDHFYSILGIRDQGDILTS